MYLCIFSVFPSRSTAAYRGRALFSLWFSSEVSAVFEQQGDALSWVSPGAVKDTRMFEAPAVSLVLCYMAELDHSEGSSTI